MVNCQLHALCITPKERASGTLWIGGWMSPPPHLNAGLDNVKKSNNSLHLLGIEP
jgi:hypothetical protein